jgi:hypothetical protein
MDEVEVCTGCVERFCNKMHKAAAITGLTLSKLLNNKDKSFWWVIVAKKYTFSALKTVLIEHTSASCKACQKSDRKIDVSSLSMG